MTASRVGVVVLTHDRPRELARTLERLRALPERPAIVVVDNASRAGAVDAVLRDFPGVDRVRCERNLGAAGRNAGVARLATPYVAFCDDDTWWAPGALACAERLLDAHAQVAVLSGRVLVGPEERLDPTCAAMAASPLAAPGLPGPALVGFMAGACVMRTQVYRELGGYEPRLFLGAEEWLLALDVLARGGHIVYADGVVTHHHPSPVARDAAGRCVAVARNKLWIAVMRLPAGCALREVAPALAQARRRGLLPRVLREALPGLAWAWRGRRVVPAPVVAMLERVRAARAGAPDAGRAGVGVRSRSPGRAP
jgi:GT2 family glycosyltransferase